MLPDALDRALTMLESQRLAVPHGGHQVSMILLQPRAQNYRGQLQPQRIELGGRAARALPEWRWYAADCGRRSQWRCGQCVCDIVGATLPQHVVHIRSFFEVARAGSSRLAALSGPEDAVEAIITQRRLGSGWVSRFLQEILYEMLADKEAFHTVTTPGISTPPGKRRCTRCCCVKVWTCIPVTD